MPYCYPCKRRYAAPKPEPLRQAVRTVARVFGPIKVEHRPQCPKCGRYAKAEQHELGLETPQP